MAIIDRAPNPDGNYRFKGTGRGYSAEVGGTELTRLGAFENIEFEINVEKDEVQDTEEAARATVLTAISSTDANLNFGLRELTGHNLQMLLMSESLSDVAQSESYLEGVAKTLVADKFLDMGKMDCTVLKITHGVLDSGNFAAGETLTETGGWSGKIAWADTVNKYVEVINPSGTLEVGDTITNGTNSATVTAIETIKDFVVCDKAPDDTPTTRYVAGTDYDTDPDYGMVRKLSEGSIAAAVYISANYAALDTQVMHGLSSGTVSKKLVFQTDKDDTGARFRVTFHKVEISLSGSFPLLGDDLSVLPVAAKVIKDTSQASGQEYFKFERVADAA